MMPKTDTPEIPPPLNLYHSGVISAYRVAAEIYGAGLVAKKTPGAILEEILTGLHRMAGRI
jgi:hypothetical protein